LLTSDENKILEDMVNPKAVMTQVSHTNRFENVETEIETMLRDSRFPKEKELETICRDSFYRFTEECYEIHHYMEGMRELKQLIQERSKSARVIFKILSEYSTIMMEIFGYQHLDNEGLIEKTTNITYSEIFSETLSVKLDNAKIFLHI